MSDYIIIRVKNNINRFIDKCNKYKLELLNVNYINKDEILVKIKKENLDMIKKYNYYSDITEDKKVGLDLILDKIINLKYIVIGFIICLILMSLSSKVILKINVIHSNKNIRELLISELNNYGIKKFSIKKNFYELEKIENKILEENKDKLEWISINNIGMTYEVRIEERILDKYEKESDYCNIISTKDAMITSIYSTNGENLVNVNDYVKKNDILISGNILFNEENKGTTCAKGTIYGNVWYNVTVNLNKFYEKKEYTGKTRYNIKINNKILLKNKFIKFDKDYLIKNKFFSIYKEKEYVIKKYKYSETEAEKTALEEVTNKFKDKLNDKGTIIDKKVLKKEINNDYIYMEVFVITNEIISKQE